MSPWQKTSLMRFSFYSLAAILLVTIVLGFKSNISTEKIISFTDTTKSINPQIYIATLTFDGNSLFDKGETCFPQSFIFNTTQDGNADGKIDIEDNLENLVLYSIGNSISGNGRTGLASRGPNDQRPAVYFHYDTAGTFQVYEYWLYYADNDWINNHEHDWEKYFVYVNDEGPQFIKLSHHNAFTSYSWNAIQREDGFPILGIHRGSHALENKIEDGVRISHDGKVTANKGKLLSGNNETIPWVIFSNDKNVSGVFSFSQTTETFYYGDPVYFSNGKELGDPNKAPWKRLEWGSPPMP